MAVAFEEWAEIAPTKAERRDVLEMAKTIRQAAADLEASADTVRELDQRKPRSAG